MLRGRRTERFLFELLIQHVKTTCKKAGKTTNAAPARAGNPRVTGIQAEIKFGGFVVFFFYISTFSLLLLYSKRVQYPVVKQTFATY